jgi:hypothetical protein
MRQLQIIWNHWPLLRVDSNCAAKVAARPSVICPEENFMVLKLRAAAFAAVICLALPAGFVHAAPKSTPATLVIVFKDGHRQSFNLSEIERVEFPAASAPAASSTQMPSRSHFLGKWEVGDGNGRTFYITLYDDGAARKTLGDSHGRWEYVDGEVQITWDDGWHDAIRKVGSGYKKFAYGEGKSFKDKEDNSSDARNTTPHPI